MAGLDDPILAAGNPNVPSTFVQQLNRLKFVISKLGLFIFFILYTAFGAKIFQILEHPSEVQRQQASGLLLIEARQQFLDIVFNISRAEINKESFLEEASVKLISYEEIMELAAENGISALEPEVPHYKWNFIESVFFASTVITTIGYGNMAPVTLGGRVFCILYGFVGIPVTLTVIADLGTIFANIFSSFYKSFKEKRKRSSQRSGKPMGDKAKRGLIVLGAVMALLVYMAIGAGLFSSWEDWTFFEAFYFCFITMTTIGLGDLVPAKTEFILVCTVYILIGLALTSTIIELVRRQYAESWEKMKELSSRLGELSGPLAEHFRRLGHTDLNLDLNINPDFTELRNAIHLSRLEALYKHDPKYKNDAFFAELMRTHFGNNPKEEEEKTSPVKKKIVQVIIYETSL